MKTRIIHTKIYDDSWYIKLSRASKLLFIYLISNSNVGLTDMYEIPDGKICYQTGLNQAELDDCKDELKEKVFFYKDWVRIPNLEKYQTFSGSKNEIAKEKERKLIPPDVMDRLSIGYQYPMHSLSNHKSEIRNKKPIISNKKPTEKDFKKIAEDYNVPLSFVLSKWDDIRNYCKSTGKKYKDYTATLRNWVKKDAIKIRKDNYYAESRKAIDATNI